MPFYRDLDASQPADERTLERLLTLRDHLERAVPERTLDENLLLATWNIRDFDKSSYGERLEEAIYYIAEIISHFDLVAVQEVYRDMRGLERVMRVLGSHWDYICSDATEGSHGNDERMAFLFDHRKVKFGGIAGELVLPPVKTAAGTIPMSQIWRTPFVVGFKCGWTRFLLATVHITWGESTAEPQERIDEIRHVAQFLKKRSNDETAWARNLILLGDFNIFSPEDATFTELQKAGFVVPDELQRLPSNALRVRHYDQIAFRVRPGSLDQTGQAGVFDFYEDVFRIDDEEIYRPDMVDYDTKKDGTPRSERSKKNYYKTYWRTHQMSDHLPMWTELKIDYTDEYLRYKLSKDSS